MMRRLLILFLGLVVAGTALTAQETEPSDSLVRLLSAQKARLIEKNGRSYREVTGDVRFLHNNTYLHCDTALWNVKNEYIDAIGNVKIIQENTVLSGDKLHYIIKRDLAQFRGTLVELMDKDRNCLRTKFLDYNTKDSVATFWSGGSMMDKDGNLIESMRGVYDSKLGKFTFSRRVQMFTDSLFFVADSLRYYSERNYAEFESNLRGWRNDNYLEADSGWYDRERERMFFEEDVYVQTPDYEVWCERLHYDRAHATSLLEEKVRILDTASQAVILSDRLLYEDARKYAELTHQPAVIYYGETETGVRDTLFLAADTLICQNLRMYEVDSTVIAAARYRREQSKLDPVGNATKKKTESGRSTPEGGGRGGQQPGSQSGPQPGAQSGPQPGAQSGPQPGSRPGTRPGSQPTSNDDYPRTHTPSGPRGSFDPELQDTTRMRPPEMSQARRDSSAMMSMTRRDTSAMMSMSRRDSSLMRPASRDTSAMRSAPRDTTSMTTAPEDSTQVQPAPVPEPPKDTTQVLFMKAYRNVRLYRSDMQVICDSLEYTGIDSIARLYLDPVLWNDVSNQLTADSMQLVMENGQMSKGILNSNAYLIAQQDTLFYNQIKGAEMIGYFRDNELYRFDALGGASALFFLAEDSSITTMNQKESAMMSSLLKDNNIERSIYLDGIKNDFFPIVELTQEQKFLRDFKWRPQDRPVDRHAITDAQVPKSERNRKISRYFPKFRNSDTYFPGYIPGILREIEVRDSMSRLPRKPVLSFDIDTVATYLLELAVIEDEAFFKEAEEAKKQKQKQERDSKSKERSKQRKKMDEPVIKDKPVRRKPPVLAQYPLRNRRDTAKYQALAQQYALLAQAMDTVYILQDSLFRSADTMWREDVRYAKRVIRYYERQERKLLRIIHRKEKRLQKRLDVYMKPEDENENKHNEK